MTTTETTVILLSRLEFPLRGWLCRRSLLQLLIAVSIRYQPEGSVSCAQFFLSFSLTSPLVFPRFTLYLYIFPSRFLRTLTSSCHDAGSLTGFPATISGIEPATIHDFTFPLPSSLSFSHFVISLALVLVFSRCLASGPCLLVVFPFYGLILLPRFVVFSFCFLLHVQNSHVFTLSVANCFLSPLFLSR